MDAAEAVPRPPKITEEQLRQCRESGDYCPVLFQWYQFCGSLCVFLAILRRDSPAIKRIAPIEYYVLVGLLNRCARLMLANVALSHEGLFGETTAIIDRCIFESAVKIRWLCESSDPERFRRFLGDGLKTELEFKSRIEASIQARGGERLVIEERMLKSIENHIASSGLSELEVASAKKLPDLASMIDSLGHDRLHYLVGQKMGSHHIHGTWPSLRLHYLEEHEGELAPRDHDCPTHQNQYMFIPFVVLGAMKAYARYVLEEDDAQSLVGLFDSVSKEIDKINKEAIGNDFEFAKVV